jgi:dihydropteroate synthase
MACFNARDFCFPLGKQTYIMGILNITPDSFSDGGLYLEPGKAVERALEMERQGADIIDIGAQSTRPGAPALTAQDELERLSPVLEALKGKLTVPVSIDTFFVKTAAFALKNEAAVINDVSGTVSEELAHLIREYRAGWVIMHNRGGAQAVNTEYKGGVIKSVSDFFKSALAQTKKFGLENEHICLDAGIGFGKSHEDNLLLLRKLDRVKIEGVALLTGASRKRVVGFATGEENPDRRISGTVAAHTAAIAGGTDFIRVHDVPQALQGAKMADALFRNKTVLRNT